jgi:hypothetical protein
MPEASTIRTGGGECRSGERLRCLGGGESLRFPGFDNDRRADSSGERLRRLGGGESLDRLGFDEG